MPFKDITGKRFGRLVVIKRHDQIRRTWRWLCQCDCGNTTFVITTSLLNGDTKSCGCLRTIFNDITGQRFGHLVAISRHDQNTRRAWRWLCQCDCGKTTIAVIGSLTSGRHQSCGCTRPQLARLRLRANPIYRKVTTPLLRFEAKYIPEPNSGCWLWLGALNVKGYGVITKGRNSEGNELAHRMAWRLFRGPIPERLDVLHHCDMPCCVNPDHLFLGTHIDNMNDMIAKGRNSAPPIFLGETHHMAKLTTADVQMIKRRRENGETISQLAKAYSVVPNTIYRIISGKGWTHIQ